jgi:hypothetical protein
MHQIGHQVDQGRRPALLADIGQFDAGDLKQFLRGKIDRRAGARIAEIELAGFAAR